ncbi:MAG: hypothetical protein KJZ78_04140, partial [Bryobacteraceae bacterium]|nr:hypothetical protein [Bryobacteraceae bacterium]
AVNTVSIQAGYSQATTLVPTLDRGVTYTATLENPFPDGVLSPVGPAGGIMTDAGRAISAFNPGIRSPYAQRWSFNIQHLLPAGFLLDAGYVGNRSTKLTVNRDMNALPNQYLSTLPVRDVAHINWLGTVWPNPFGDLLPGTSRSGATTSRATLLLPYPHFTSISIPTNQGYSWYHGMQVRSEKRFSRGFTTLLSYTWSKTMQATELLNAGDPVPYRVISPMDRTHSLSFSGIWELPLGQGRHFLSAAPPVIRQIVSGWQVGAIWLAMSGTPLSFGNVIFNGDIKNIPLPENERTYYRAFNTEAGFDRNSSNQLANNLRTFPLRFSGIRSDGYTTWDLSLIKQTRLTEKTSMQLRAEFLNAFNHPNFQIPNTSPVSSTFGRVPGENSFPREIQLALKFLF